jgi:hypothetical protein
MMEMLRGNPRISGLSNVAVFLLMTEPTDIHEKVAILSSFDGALSAVYEIDSHDNSSFKANRSLNTVVSDRTNGLRRNMTQESFGSHSIDAATWKYFSTQRDKAAGKVSGDSYTAHTLENSVGMVFGYNAKDNVHG